MKTFLLKALQEKEKTWIILDDAYRRNIGELTASVEGTKFFLEDRLVFFFKGDLESDHLKRPQERQTFVEILNYLFHFHGKVNYIFNCEFTL